MSDLIKFVSARQWRKAVQEYNSPDPDFQKVAPDGLGVRLGFNAEIETLKATQPKPEGRQLLIAISSQAVDRDTDTIAVDGWKLEQYRKNPVVLFGHRYFNNDAPVVGMSLTEYVHGKKLKSLMEFTPQGMVPLADMLYGLYSEGFMNAASVGFVPLEWEFAKDEDKRPWGIDFLEQELVEYSLVPVPANADALVEARSKGIDTSPMVTYTEEVLDAWSSNKKLNLWIPKSALKELRDAADPNQPTTAQVPRGDLGDHAIRHEGAAATWEDLKRMFPVATRGLIPPKKGEPPESGKSGIQTVIFDKEKWAEGEAKKWLDDHDFESSKVDETDSSYRFRQFDPEACEDGSFVTLTENFPEGVSAVSCTAKACQLVDASAIPADQVVDPAAVIERGEVDPNAPRELSIGGVTVELSPEAAEAMRALASGSELADKIRDGFAIQLVQGSDRELMWDLTPWHCTTSTTGTDPAVCPDPGPAPDPDPDPAPVPEPEAAPDEGSIELSEGAEAAIDALGIDLDQYGTEGADDVEEFVIVDQDGEGSEERGLSGLGEELLEELISEDVEAAINRATRR
jgi:hypothetical protein